MILGFKTYYPKTKEPTHFVEKILDGRKIHSIREGDRWEPGMIIHYATGVRTKNYQCFKIDVCRSQQKIIIEPPKGKNSGIIVIDGKKQDEVRKKLLSSNDGFVLLSFFWQWFDDTLDGQIIHWTNFKY